MNITYDKHLQPLVIKAIAKNLRGRNCYYCGIPLHRDNLAGAIKKDKLKMFCNSLPCLLEMNDDSKAD